MVMERKIIPSALVELGKEESTTRDNWLTVDAWKKLIYICYDFDSTIDFSISDFNRALNLLGTVHLKVLTGNNTGMHLREKFCPVFNKDGKNTGKTQRKLFLLLQQTMRVLHRSQVVDTDTGYPDNEVCLFEIERSCRLI
jgi:hypothetical protein